MIEQRTLMDVIAGLDTWLETMRLPGGYGGPVAHWWRDCLDYTGPGLDWRYEGILCGYLDLWRATSDPIWLGKARRAGDDLLAGQLPSGNFRNSRFEQNPGTGGTPHEAGCDIGLLCLAETLRGLDDPAWERYFHAAERNLRAYYLARLWDDEARSFRDDPTRPSFVPNKSATLAEALFACARLTGQAEWAERYALPALEAVIAHQHPDGAICQNSFGLARVEKYFPYYIARCIPGLLLGWVWSGREIFASAAHMAAGYVLRSRLPDGSFPQVFYPGGKVNKAPRWVAACGDILRVLELARATGFTWNPAPTLEWLLTGRLANGAFRTARGFGQAQPLGRKDDPRDGLAVVGWNDKALRFFAGLARGGEYEPF
jgi:hypothetical protein